MDDHVKRFAIHDVTPAQAAQLAEFGARTFYESFADDNTADDMRAHLESAWSPEKQLAGTRVLEGTPLELRRDRVAANGPAIPRCGSDRFLNDDIQRVTPALAETVFAGLRPDLNRDLEGEGQCYDGQHALESCCTGVTLRSPASPGFPRTSVTGVVALPLSPWRAARRRHGIGARLNRHRPGRRDPDGPAVHPQDV